MLAVAPAWSAKPVGGAQPATRRRQGQIPPVLAACIRLMRDLQPSRCQIRFVVDCPARLAQQFGELELIGGVKYVNVNYLPHAPIFR